MDAIEIKRIIEAHKLFLNGVSEGVKADLREADLRGANLRGADLREADLSGADLRGADLPHKIVSVSCIGSSKRMTTFDTKNNIVWCGCFKGTIEEFEKRVEETHKSNAEHLKDYRAAIAFFKATKES